MNLPNTISIMRFLMMPVLVYLAWVGQKNAFLLLLALCFFSDVLDGWIARQFNLQTQLGAKLDSWSDFFNYSAMALGGWLLWPEIMSQEFIYVTAIIASFVLPAIAGLIKFRCLTSYHTWAVKLAALMVGISGMWLFAGGPPWVFHLAVPFCIYAAVEEIMITMISSQPQTNIRNFWHAKERIQKCSTE